MDPSNNTASDFASGISTPVDVQVGPEGSLYYLIRGGTGQVWRVSSTITPTPTPTPARQHPLLQRRPNANTHTYSYRDLHSNACHPNSPSHRNAHRYTHTYSGCNAHTHSRRYTDAHANSDTNATPPPAAQALNLSTRMRVQTGDNVGIGGFIITGTAPKHLLLRAIGPSLTRRCPNALADPVLELHGPGAFATITNDNWRDDPAQEAAILATGIAPTNNLESAIDATLNPGAYTAVVRGKNNTSGVALIEVYDLSQAVSGEAGQHQHARLCQHG